jgi:hypothetical protein
VRVAAAESGAWIDRGEAGSTELLPGEVPTSQASEDAEHWVAVYSELVDFLGRHPETEVIRRTIERYRERLWFWRGRRDELSADRELDYTTVV